MRHIAEAMLFKRGEEVQIGDRVYKIESKTTYVTETSLDEYIKYTFTDHKVLVVIPNENIIYLGERVDDIESGQEFSDEIMYMNNVFTKLDSDYQIVKSVEYGNPQETEGEVVWADYTCKRLPNVYISCAWSFRDDSRVDIVGRLLNVEEIMLV